MIPLTIAVVAVLIALIDYCLANSHSSKLQRPKFWLIAYKYLLFSSIGITGLYYTAVNFYNVWQSAASLRTFYTSPFFLAGISGLALSITGLFSPFASRGFRGAVIAIYSIQTYIVTVCFSIAIFVREVYTFDETATLLYGLILPSILIIMYSSTDKFNVFHK